MQLATGRVYTVSIVDYKAGPGYIDGVRLHTPLLQCMCFGLVQTRTFRLSNPMSSCRRESLGRAAAAAEYRLMAAMRTCEERTH